MRVVSETLSAIIATSRRGRTRPALFVGLAGDAPRSPVARFTLGGVDVIELGRGPLRRREQRSDQGARVAALTLADARMSTTHARITRVGGAWVLEDRGSKNGTWVGGERITRRPLVDGDAILVGHTVLVYRDSGGEDIEKRFGCRATTTDYSGCAASHCSAAASSCLRCGIRAALAFAWVASWRARARSPPVSHSARASASSTIGAK